MSVQEESFIIVIAPFDFLVRDLVPFSRFLRGYLPEITEENSASNRLISDPGIRGIYVRSFIYAICAAHYAKRTVEIP